LLLDQGIQLPEGSIISIFLEDSGKTLLFSLLKKRKFIDGAGTESRQHFLRDLPRFEFVKSHEQHFVFEELDHGFGVLDCFK
jgi:hypothetical protein